MLGAAIARGTERSRRQRRVASQAVQQEVFVRLLAGVAGFFVLALVAIYLFLSVAAPRTARSVLPVLDGYMLAGQAEDVRGAHRLFSSRALRTVRAEDIAQQFADRRLFDGYQGLTITTLRFSSLVRPGETTAEATALVRYVSGPAGQLTARLTLEGNRWRLESIRVERRFPW